MLTKITNRLFHSKYQYKIVLICAGASYFKDRDINQVFQYLSKLDLAENAKLKWGHRSSPIKDKIELDYTLQILMSLQSMEGYDLRVESPWLSFYTNNKQDVDTLANIDSNQVKYISMPPSNGIIEKNSIILPKMDFEFRVTLGKTSREHSTFVQWAQTNRKVKLTKSCARDLAKHNSWGGTYFYLTGDNNLLMAKMHLGDAINKVERIIKA
jgi:hypothetical protein